MIEELFSILVLNDHFKLSPFIITSDLNLKMWCAKSELKFLCFACFLKDLFCPDFFWLCISNRSYNPRLLYFYPNKAKWFSGKTLIYLLL